MKKLPIILHLIFFCFSIFAQNGNQINYGNNPSNGDKVAVNGIQIYYESYGKGFPLFLLHGNGGSIISSRRKIKYFEKMFRVIAVDSRAHGNSTDDLSKELNYNQMAEDISVLMDSLNIEKANFFGQSDGGILGLLLAIHYPEKVNKLCTFGVNIRPGNDAIFEPIRQLFRDTVRLSENPGTIRHHQLMIDQPNISIEELQKIECPVLLMSGDRDAIKLSHTFEIFENIEFSNLFIMPGATHGGSWEKPDLFNLILDEFLNKPFSNKSTVDFLLGKK